MKKYIVAVAILAFATPALASVAITSATLSSPTANPGQTVDLTVEANRTGSACTNNWITTDVTIDGVTTSYPVPNTFLGTGLTSVTVEVVAPATPGVYEVLAEVRRGSEPSLTCSDSVWDSATTSLEVIAPVVSTPEPARPTMSSGGSTPCYILMKAYGLTECDSKGPMAMRYVYDAQYHWDTLLAFWAAMFR